MGVLDQCERTATNLAEVGDIRASTMPALERRDILLRLHRG